MPRKKTEADERYNTRRRAKRLAVRLERENSESAKRVISRLNEMIRETYGRASTKIRQTQTLLEKFMRPLRDKTLSKNVTLRRNEIFKQAMRSKAQFAGREKVENTYFWRATQRIWQGTVDKEERYKAISAYFDKNKEYQEYLKSIGKEGITGDLQNIYDFVLSSDNSIEILDELEQAGEVPEQYASAIFKVVIYG